MPSTGKILLTAALLSACGCGSTVTAPTASFALDAGSYTLKISGGGAGGGTSTFCLISGSSTIEGSVPVVVTRLGSTWSARAASSPDATWVMSFTTDGAATGVAIGSMGGVAVDATTNISMIVTLSSVDGRNSSTNVAGGAIQGAVRFATIASGSATCTQGTWTLTPR